MIFALFTALLVAALWFILKETHVDLDDTSGDPVAYFKKQLADLESEEESGLIDSDSAKAARLEIERRLLKAAKVSSGNFREHAQSHKMRVATAVIVVAASVGLYSMLGSPFVPASPAARNNALETPIEEGGPTFGEAIERIEDHLREKPADMKGWQVLARTSQAVGQYDQAASAFEQLIRSEPENPRWRAEYLEMFLVMGSGRMSPAAKLALDDFLEVLPDHPAAQYYLGLYQFQQDDKEGAKAVWTALADRSEADAPWMPQVTARLQELGVKPPKISQEQMDTVNAMSADDRAAFVDSMIERLRGRLEENPDDPEGWLMLARSEAAQGRVEAAIETLQQALRILPPSKIAALQAFLDNLQENRDP